MSFGDDLRGMNTAVARCAIVYFEPIRLDRLRDCSKARAEFPNFQVLIDRARGGRDFAPSAAFRMVTV
jgi:hypothetical protein